MDLTADIFGRFDGLVFVMPCGVVVRAVAPHLSSKKTDPAVVVTDVLGRHAISLAGGHEGGANDLAYDVANILGAEPIVTTTTEAVKTVIVGVGCRKGIAAENVEEAVRAALAAADVSLNEVRCLASADVKLGELGLIEAAKRLSLPLRFIASAEIASSPRDFEHSEFVMEKVNLPAVAEPAALLAGRRTRLILRKIILDGVTVAVARES
jgi:cobalt-precorrin 5A hydrolase